VATIESAVGAHLEDVQKKFHPHHDYLSFVIPSAWFLVGLVILDFRFYDSAIILLYLKRIEEFRSHLQNLSTSLEFFLALVLFVATFSTAYVLGQILNGISALAIDRFVVKKVLKYPFELYRERYRRPPSEIDTHRLFHSLVLQSSYLAVLTTLFPLLAAEAAAIIIAMRHPSARWWFSSHPWITTFVAIATMGLHLGLPSQRFLRYATNRTETQQDLQTPAPPKTISRSVLKFLDRITPEQYPSFFWTHVIVFLFASLTSTILLLHGQVVCVIVTLLGYNSILLAIDRSFKKHHNETGLPSLEKLLFYVRLTFADLATFAANLVGYGETPSTKLIGSLLDSMDPDCHEKDFFWLTYLIVQNEGGGSLPTTYHFLSNYGMVRNLCSSTICLAVASAAAFASNWPLGKGSHAALWILVLFILAYSLFARFLYLYSSYFSKYVLRSAAFALERRKSSQE